MPTESSKESKIDWLLSHGVERIFPSQEALKQKLLKGEKIRLYLGIDPTAPTLHLGHIVNLRKLAEFQKLGHEVILLIGDFTAMIGDPTDKGAVRKQLTREEVLINCKLYKKQASKFLTFSGTNPAKLKFNSKWLSKMSFEKVLGLASHFTVQQILERDMFERRYRGQLICPKCGHTFVSPIAMQFIGPTPKHEEEGTGNFWMHSAVADLSCPNCQTPFKGYIEDNLMSNFFTKNVIKPKPIYLHEFLYPLMQGFDSVAMDVDLEVGGNDQTFNMLAGRDLQSEINHKNKFVMAMRLLVDSTGKKMGKSEGNMVALTDSPDDIFGKVMSWPDTMIIPGWEILTDATEGDLKLYKQDLESKNPMFLKRLLAHKIVSILVDAKAAEKADQAFTSVHQKKEMPRVMSQISVHDGEIKTLLDVVSSRFTNHSRSEARRLIVDQNGIKVNNVINNNPQYMPKKGDVIQKGKLHFVEVV